MFDPVPCLTLDEKWINGIYRSSWFHRSSWFLCLAVSPQPFPPQFLLRASVLEVVETAALGVEQAVGLVCLLRRPSFCSVRSQPGDRASTPVE